MARRRTYWICQVTGWSLYAVVNVTLALLVQSASWKVAASNAAAGVLGLGFTHAYRGYARRRRWSNLPPLRLAPRVILASAVVGIAMTALLLGVLFGVLRYTPAGPLRVGGILVTAVNLTGTVLLWSFLYFGLHYFRTYKQAEVDRWQLEAAVKDAELRALKAQLNPHFLFNSLNSLRALIPDDPPQAQRMVTQLAGLLRYALQAGHVSVVPLAEELKAVRTYLDLEAIRLEERLRYTLEAGDDVLDVPVPAMLVQTLVENAIKHGVARLPAGGTVRLEARRNDETLCLRVFSSGQLQPDGRTDGVGLRNASERLRLLYGERARLALTNASADTVLAAVAIPLEPHSPEHAPPEARP